MKFAKKTPFTKQQKILIPVGVGLLALALIFGILKFNDIFSDKADPNQVSTNINQTAEDQEESAKETQGDVVEHTAEPSDSSTPAESGLADAVGTPTWVVNKRRPLEPKNYVPPQLVFPDVKLRVPGNESMRIRDDVGAAVKHLFTAAITAGHNPMFSSGYRSYTYQTTLYNSYVNRHGQAAADRESARPGYSEHQTGYAFDICNADDCQLIQSFGSTPLGQWVAAHAHEYGFTIRYKKGMEHVTGYIYEPWHLRYVGVNLATELYQSGKTLEEHFGLPAAPDYQ